MIRATCIEKFRDKNEKIIGYRLQDCNGSIQDIKSDDLKKMIIRKQIEVDNLTLTSDNRLITSDAKNYIGNSKYTLADIRELGKNCEIYKKYQPIFTLVDIDIVGCMYLRISEGPDSTVEGVLSRTFDNYGDTRKTEFMKSFNAKELLNNKSYLVGQFIDNDATMERDSSDGAIFHGTKSEFRVPILLLHKNNELQLVMLGELNYRYNPTTFTLDFFDDLSGKDSASKQALTVITIDSTKKVQMTNVGKHISKREAYILARNIANSKIDYWVGTEATKDLLSKVDKKEATDNLKSMGIGTLAIPFSVVVAISCLGLCLLGGIGEGHSESSGAPYDNSKRVGRLRRM